MPVRQQRKLSTEQKQLKQLEKAVNDVLKARRTLNEKGKRIMSVLARMVGISDDDEAVEMFYVYLYFEMEKHGLYLGRQNSSGSEAWQMWLPDVPTQWYDGDKVRETLIECAHAAFIKADPTSLLAKREAVKVLGPPRR